MAHTATTHSTYPPGGADLFLRYEERNQEMNEWYRAET